MADGIGRKRVIGIAKETTYGTSAVSPTFHLNVTETPITNVIVKKVENTAGVGSTYGANVVETAYSYVEGTLNFKVDENSLPLILGQKFTITSALYSTETAVYQHSLAYSSSNTGGSIRSYTLFVDDPDRGDYTVSGVMFGNINFSMRKDGFVMATADFRGKAKTSGTVTISTTSPREFVGRHVTTEYGTTGGSLTALTLLELDLTHEFKLSDDNINVALGASLIDVLYTTEDRFEATVKARYTDYNLQADYENNTQKDLRVAIVDTGRYVTGTILNTRPNITFRRPVNYLLDHKAEGALGDIMTQTITLLATDTIGVSNTPEAITIINNVASY